MSRIPHGSAAFAALAGLLLTGCAARVEVEIGDGSPPATPVSTPVITAPEPPPADGLMSVREWNGQWTALLRQYVSPQPGVVDYAALRQHDRSQLRALVEALAPARTFETERHRLAFLLNAYNALIVHAIVEHEPVTSPRAIEGLFTKRRFDVLGSKVTLEELRDRLIRPLDDPRAHMAMCSAALGSPPLRNEAYTVEQLDGQLNEQCRRFLASPAHNTALGDLLLVSPIFEWFATDFEGPPFDGVAGFMRLYADENSAMSRLLRRTAKPLMESMDFNWALNAR